ncbi:class I SAM-dependent methyltransferase [Paenibacillus sp. LHD-117]|uniref:class I SAM-dependent methyltransferase n=1 Tax=Paenibacillus sp. LHD-117 TaxID=3071412 RepID=UPI0027E0D809|nr:class I SAM-dependent methyltransferase [Paenibacillus sp. LHD-117]MDQ6417877.1 class I SAM-dependent methyltransferase [Paenibacillus sp. LHD-117]
MDEKLLNYYLELRSPDSGEWNLSPQCLHTELITRDYISKSFAVTNSLQVCNVGIGMGDWDNYLGYWLNGRGTVTSIDINKAICEIFEYRQRREGHPNPSKVLCMSIFDEGVPAAEFEIVTLIGSAINETGNFNKCLDSCFGLLKPGGHLMFMANTRKSPVEMVEQYIRSTEHQMEELNTYDAFPEYPFYICKIKKPGETTL